MQAMNRYSIFLLLAAAAFGLTACGNNDEAELSGNSALNEIRLSSTLAANNDAPTRAVNEQNVGNFVNGQSIDIFMFEDAASPTTTYSQPIVATTSGASIDIGTEYWPVSGNSISLWGWYPSKSTTGVTMTRTDADLSVAGSFTIDPDQEADNATRLNDLMVGLPTANPITKSSYLTTPIPLSFTHLLSKIVVVLKVGTGTSKALLAGAKLTIPGIYTQVAVSDWKPASASGIVSTVTSGDTPPTGTLKIAEVPAAGDSKWQNDGTDYFTSAAILPPQDLNTNAKKLTITLSDGGVTTYAIPHDFAAGNIYTYTVTVNRTGLTVSSTITPWPASGDNYHTGSHVF